MSLVILTCFGINDIACNMRSFHRLTKCQTCFQIECACVCAADNNVFCET